MKYNILTIASKSYYPFLDVFLNSLFENCDTEKINKIYIVAVDLDDYINFLYKSNKIVYLTNDNKDEYGGVHSNGWYNTTKLKTEYLKDILNEIPEGESLLMIDSDTVFLNDIYDVINKDYDIQITQMSDGAHISASGILILHIACFMIFNNIEKSKSFVEKWISNKQKLLEDKKRKPHETPAMNQVINDKGFIKDFKIQSLDDRIVCADCAVYPNTKIIHFKSDGMDKKSPLQNFIDRFSKIKCFDENQKNLNYIKYLQRSPFKLWSSEDFNVTKESFYNINQNYKRK
jgi:hypothetical protein